jgi:2'-5' RNA ligase
VRLFVALDLDEEVRAELAGLVARLRAVGPAAAWVPRDNLHLTFAFLGEAPGERVGEIEAALRRAADRPPFDVRLGRIGAFPSPGRARVLWVGIEDPGGELAALAEAVREALAPLGFPPERRPWQGHLTLARLRHPADVTALAATPVAPLSVRVEALTLFRSDLGRPAARYEALRRVPLAAPGAPAARDDLPARPARDRGALGR